MLYRPIKPMLLHKIDTSPEGSYVAQPKWDGIRCLYHFSKHNGVKLFTRHQNELNQFPEIVGNINAYDAVIDGELIVIQNKRDCFESVLKRFQTKTETNIKRLAKMLPAHFVAFDVLYLNGKDVTKLDQEHRLEILNQIITPSEALTICPTTNDGKLLFSKMIDLGWEGCVYKKIGKGTAYQLNTRSYNWLKHKNYQFETVEITGIRKTGDFGWSIARQGKYVGVMEFVPPNARKAFHGVAKQIIQKETDDWIYLEPILKCRVKFQSYTKKGLMRSPSFQEFVLTEG